MARWLARIPATQLARSRLQSSSERGSARFCFHFLARAYVQGTPDARLLKPRHVFRRIFPAGLFCSNQQIPRLCRTLAGESRTGRFRRRSVIYFPKALSGAAGYQHLERGANEMVSNICSPNSFSTERVLLLSAESVRRRCRCRSSDFT